MWGMSERDWITLVIVAAVGAVVMLVAGIGIVGLLGWLLYRGLMSVIG